jgi:predicted TIM-barrel fold metal-dependent hydrolase
MTTSMNAWRQESPGTEGWERSARPGAAQRYFIVDTDSHANEPVDVFQRGGIPERFHDRLPRMEIDEQGNQWLLTEGNRKQMVKPAPNPDKPLVIDGLESDGQPWSDRMEEEDLLRMAAGSTSTPDQPGLDRRAQDAHTDGIDAQVVFPNRGFLAFATRDTEFSHAMCQAWNRWAVEVYGGPDPVFAAAPMIAPMTIEESIAEVEWIAGQGFRTVCLPCAPTFGPSAPGEPGYNHPRFDPLWAAIERAGLPITIHVATGRDPRAASGPGGAVINLAIGSLSQVIEPLAQFLACGIFDRHAGLRVVTVEGGIGWLPWLLQTLDEATRKHHMWVRPVQQRLPSEYYRDHCGSTFIEDPAGLALVHDWNLVDNVMWSSDYPHQEGSWPHSAQAIERQLGAFTDAERAAIVGGTAAGLFGFDEANAGIMPTVGPYAGFLVRP